MASKSHELNFPVFILGMVMVILGLALSLSNLYIPVGGVYLTPIFGLLILFIGFGIILYSLIGD